MTQGEFNMKFNQGSILPAIVMQDIYTLVTRRGDMMYEPDVAGDIALRLRARWNIRLAAAVKTIEEVMQIIKEYDHDGTGYSVCYEASNRGHLMLIIYDNERWQEQKALGDSETTILTKLDSTEHLDMDTFQELIENTLPNIDWDMHLVEWAYTGYLYDVTYNKADYHVISNLLIKSMASIYDIRNRYWRDKDVIITPTLMAGPTVDKIVCGILFAQTPHANYRVYWHGND